MNNFMKNSLDIKNRADCDRESKCVDSKFGELRDPVGRITEDSVCKVFHKRAGSSNIFLDLGSSDSLFFEFMLNDVMSPRNENTIR